MRRACEPCKSKDAELALLRAENAELKSQLRELDKLCTLQQGDLDRFRSECARLQPNRPERVPLDQLQLAFETIVATFGSPENDAEGGSEDAPEADSEPVQNHPSPPPNRGKKGHGRRRLDMSGLRIEETILDPPEVLASGGKGFVRIGEEVSDRLAFRPASYFVLRQIRRTYASTNPSRAIVCAPIPRCSWPRAMADASAIVQMILAKYDMCLPLHRQERVSPRYGFYLPRSTQCDWIGAACRYVYRIVDAMMREARSKAFCIATDATGAPVRMPGACANWHVFVFLADRDHVIFRPARDHTSDAIAELLHGFRGHLLSDAALIYDVLHREYGVTEVSCWFHLRRYFWRCRDTDPAHAIEALAIISKLFEADRATREIAMPARTTERARLARPLLALFDAWIERVRSTVEPRTPLAAALTYYENQRQGLRTFLTDGRLRLDNNISEQQLRNLVLGRRNWTFFENPTGLEWYTVFRSLIASCALHNLEPQRYLEEILRLSPHWSSSRMLELAPKYWTATRERLSPEDRQILRRPWEPDRPSAIPDRANRSVDAA